MTYRKTKSVDLDCLKQDIAKSNLCLQGCVGCPSSCEDFDKFIQKYNSTLSSILDRHAPLKPKVVRSRPQVPWYNQEIAEAKRKRLKAERKWRKTKSTEELLVWLWQMTLSAISIVRSLISGIDVNQRRCSDLIDDPVFSSNIEPLRVFKELKEKDVYQLIQASPKKSSTLDPFQTSILLGSLEELLSIITSMVNCSLTLGHFPAAWKASLVDPQLKKRC